MIHCYYRTSTNKQHDSFERQKEKAKQYCALRGLNFDAASHYDDEDVSARKNTLSRRPAGSEMLSSLRAGDLVVAMRLDRLFRNLIDGLQTLEAWREMGVSLHLIDQDGSSFDTSTAMGWAFVVDVLKYAELEARLTGERVTKQKEFARQRNLFLGGGVPFGARLVEREEEGRMLQVLEPDEEEQQVVAMAAEMRERGLSLRDISARLFELGHGSRSGGRFAPTQVSRLLRKAG